MALLIETLAPLIGGSGVVLDIAPTKQVSHRLSHLAGKRYLSIDLDPAADGRVVMAQADMTALPFPDRSVDFVLCYHVLEHVPDDRAAMHELARVLSDRGFALVQVPWRPWRDTDEDPLAPADERIRRFGQADHVRWYGTDFEDRLHIAGLDSSRMSPADLLSGPVLETLGADPREPVWILRPQRSGPGATVEDLAGKLRIASLDEFHAGWRRQGDLERQLAAARREAGRWKGSYERLRYRWPVRMVAAGQRVVRSLRR